MAETKVFFVEACGTSPQSPNENIRVGATVQGALNPRTDLCIKLGAIPDNLKYKNITDARFCLYIQSFGSAALSKVYYVYRFTEPFDVNTVTHNTAKITATGLKEVVLETEPPGYVKGISGLSWNKEYLNGIQIFCTEDLTYQTPYGANKPYILYTHDTENAGIEPSGLSPNQYGTQSLDQQFSWTPANNANTLSPLSAVSTVLQWRKNESSQIQTISANNGTSVSIPAGELNFEKIQWRVGITSNSGATKYSDWIAITMLPPRIDSPTPSSGYVPKSAPSEFNWSLVQPTGETTKVQTTQISAVFKWRESQESPINEIRVSGSESKIIVPAGTFTSDSIQWMVTATANGGATASSDWMTCTTIEPTSTAKAVSPIKTVIQSGTDLQFFWEHIITTGTAPTGFDIQYSTDKSDWKDLLSGKTSETTATLQNNALPGGTVYWRVRTYNTDNVPGAWSDPAEIIVIAPPAAPSIQLEKISPRPILRWSSLDQVAYEVEIVGVETYSQYGNANRYQSHAVLPDGLYTVRVRIQNRYAFWSAWGEASLTVFNSPGSAITLSATASKTGEVQLSWSTTGAFASYQILRNGAVIGETTERSYLDRLAIGACSYQIRGIVDSAGNYSLSGVQALTVTVPTVQIAPVSGGDWLALPYTTTDIREVSVSTSKSVTYQQFLGSPLPVGVVGEALSKSVQLSCAFPYRLQADAAKLEALIGQLVCVKDPRGRRYLGILGSMSHVSSRFYLSYSLTITPVACEEVEL